MSYRLVVPLLLVAFLGDVYAQRDFGIPATMQLPGEPSKRIVLKETRLSKNPVVFRYSTTDVKTQKEVYPQSGAVIEIQKRVRYIGASVTVDSTNDFSLLFDRDSAKYLYPAVVYLRQLVKGHFGLYEYIQNDNVRYYYSVDTAGAQLLVYRQFVKKLESGKGVTVHTREHLRQISNLIQCEATSSSKLKELDYVRDEMVELFVEMNQCYGTIAQTYPKDVKEKLFSAAIGGGIQQGTMSSLLVFGDQFGTYKVPFDLGRHDHFTFGFDLEYNFPRLNRRLGIAFSPRYASFSGKDTARLQVLDPRRTIERFSLEVPDLKELSLPIMLRSTAFRSRLISLSFGAGGAVNVPLQSDETIVRLTSDYRNLNTRSFFNAALWSVGGEVRATLYDRFTLSATYFGKHNSLKSNILDLNFRQLFVMAYIRI